jgi:glycosyltransferase involved in cell wall biosynthesis
VKLSIAIIVQNEEANLPRWLRAVAPVADEIVAVDSGSSDRTVELLERAGARVFHRDWTGYADQRNFLAEQCTGDWILMLDADEVVDDACRRTLTAFKAGPDPEEQAYELPSRVWFFGHFLRHGGFYPEWKARLYRRGAAQWARDQVHERLETRGRVGRLDCAYDHYSYASVEEYRARAVRYAEAGARHLHEEGKNSGPFTGPTHAAWAFMHRYLFRLGFLDGKAGWWAAWLEAGYTLRKYRRLTGLIREAKR